ncbi:SGNH/GDSL hydrolase family protein [Hymenobacter pini]|uniref:SGNH/GDSL hydrolase family protein n=1 Tax=Hymenobacter pini TaxID=2880879 RepID=UPI001CF4210B|nr:GDSL-type esterase/lipase family protein [Hymenobacter pini]MCA8832374.1 GDSL-type esterase/lipase family protein [Hymenobacter pini]
MARKTSLAAAALAQGKQQARRVLIQRTAALETRQQALEQRAQVAGLVAMTVPVLTPQRLAQLGSPVSAGVLIAEGDSWFDYPLTDVLTQLEDAHGYDVESVAHKGDRVESMAYDDGQLADFTRRLDKLLRRGVVPRAILLSGGGNDVAGAEFHMLLDHADSAAPGLNDDVVKGILHQRVYLAYLRILQAVTDVCRQRIGRVVPVLVHGYDYPVPDGRGYLGGWWLLPGPWLAPGFQAKGYANLAQRKQLAQELIDRFNDMLQTVAARFAHVHYVDLRQTLSTGADYEDWWANELHPTKAGFAKVAERFGTVLGALP